VTDEVYTVSAIQRLVRELLETEVGSLWVEGEISGLTRSGAGHCYFSLKDENAKLRAVMWRSTVARTRFDPEDGLQVRARGNLTVYEREGRYQFIVSRLEPLGAGPLQVRFEQMRKRLEEEGLFDPEHKRPLPRLPRRVALVTSPTGAAVRDLIHVALRRWPLLELVVVPVRVQGEGAAAEIARGIRDADGRDFDVIIAGRGGGSLEDLWAFNEEVVARAIFEANTPVVSAVGHEVDWSISDLVADLRAATPSAAAETITPDRGELGNLLRDRRRRLGQSLRSVLAGLETRLSAVRASRVFRQPVDSLLRDRRQRVDDLAARLARGLSETVRERRRRVELCAGRLDALSPLKVLARGYSVTTSGGRIVTDAAQVAAGDELETILDKGRLRSRVEPRE
jgi:exodeoxyribonuclease VII large subunit